MQAKAKAFFKSKRTIAAICAVVLSIVGAEFIPPELLTALVNVLVF